MDDVFKLIAWLKLHGNSAPWGEVQQQFSAVFPQHKAEASMHGLSAIMISNRNPLPLIGRTAQK